MQTLAASSRTDLARPLAPARRPAQPGQGGQSGYAAPCTASRLVGRAGRTVHVVAQVARGAAPPAKPPPPAATAAAAALVVTSSWPCKGGSLVRVLQGQASADQHQLRIELDGRDVPQGSTVELHWGVYRSAPHLWQHPAEVVPPGSHRNDRSGAMVSAMQPSGAGRYTLTLTVPAALVPLTAAFVVHVAPPEGAKDTAGRPVRPHFVTPLRGRHFSALIGCSPGSAEQQGVALLPPAVGQHAAASGSRAAGSAAKPSVLEFGGGAAAAAAEKHTVNFAVRCRGADRVCLVLLRPQAAAAAVQQGQQQQQGGQQQEWGMVELVLDPVLNRTGELWHIAVEGLHDLEQLCYGWRLEGDVSWESGCRVQPDLLLLDPCNPALRYFPADEASERAPLPLPTVTLPDGTRAAVASTLAGLSQELARQRQIAAAGPAAAGEAAAESFVPRPDLALEELRLLEIDVRTFAQGKGVQHPGTYLGVAERAAHIRAVGANAVVLTPSYATAKGIGLLSRAAVHYMAADPQLATRDRSTSLAAAAEFRQMVAQLHEQGIEVLLQVDVTFTAEGTDAHPSSLSLRGLDYGSYYRTNGVLNCGSAAAQQYILRTLHHWAQEGVDGFCFVNAENMVQDREGFILDAPPLADAICHDPLLKPLKLIAAPSDESLLPRSGVRGFPHWGLWQQRNAGFGRDLMAFLAEDTPGLLTAVAGRLTGSAAVFDSDWDMPGLPGDLAIGRRPAFCVNSVTVLGRQSIAELAAEAAELAAAASAASAPSPLASSPPSAATISKSLLAMAVLALGVPIIPQDAVADLPSAHFVGVLQRLRQRLAPLLLPPRFDSPRDIRWHSASDAAAEPIWDVEAAAEAGVVPERDGNYIAFSVRGPGGQAVYVGVNPYPHVVSAALPLPPPGRVWERVVDTSLQPPEDALLEGGAPVRARSMPVAAKAVIVLQAAVLETANLQQPTQYLPTQ